LIQTGIGPRKAAAISRGLLQVESLSCIVSSGFACALNASGIGDVLVGTEVVEHPAGGHARPLPCSSSLAMHAMKAADAVKLAAAAGRFVSTARVVCRGEEKRGIARVTQGLGLDMESAALAAAAQEAGISFTIIRTVSDVRDEDLPLDFNLFLRPTGWISGVAACLRDPSSVIGLSRLRKQSHMAGMHLTQFYEKFLSAETLVTFT
jgi:adenosylhomocysteine nucleosidase